MELMEWTSVLGNVGEFVGAVAVVVTLVYLTVQLRQNTKSVQTASNRAWSDSIANCMMPICQSKDLSDVLTRGISDSRDLSEDTWVQFVVWHQQVMYTVQATYLAHQQGNVHSTIYEQEIARALSILEWPGSRQWWDAGGKDQVAREFADMLELKLGEPQRFAGLLWDKESGFYRNH